MKTSEEIIRHAEILKDVYSEMLTEEACKLKSRVNSGLENFEFASSQIAYLREMRGRISALDNLIEYAKVAS